MTEENIQVPFKAVKPLNPFKKDTDERRQKIAGLANQVGFRNLDKEILAEQFKVSQQTIYNDINWIKGHFKFDKLQDAQMELHIANSQALKAAMRLAATNPNPENIKTSIEASKNYERYLESFKIKEKTPDKYEHNVRGYKFELVEAPQTSNQPKAEDSA